MVVFISDACNCLAWLLPNTSCSGSGKSNPFYSPSYPIWIICFCSVPIQYICTSAYIYGRNIYIFEICYNFSSFLIGMKNRNCCWESGVLTVSRQLCHLQCCLLIACTLESLLLQLMLLLIEARLLFSTIQGTSDIHFGP